MKHKSLARILALNLRPRSFGYVVIESPGDLLDWGVCGSYRKTKRHPEVLVGGRLRPLLQLWSPTFLVISGAQRKPPRQKLLRDNILKGVVAEAKNNHVSVRILMSAKNPTKKLTKYERAREVVAHFPILAEKLPPKRKPWESERYSMSVFEALALATSYFFP